MTQSEKNIILEFFERENRIAEQAIKVNAAEKKSKNGLSLG